MHLNLIFICRDLEFSLGLLGRLSVLLDVRRLACRGSGGVLLGGPGKFGLCLTVIRLFSLCGIASLTEFVTGLLSKNTLIFHNFPFIS